jgi:dATP pyrophosphohydrolase
VQAWKIPESVLVVIHTAALEVLLIERTDHPGFWQSVTGSLDQPDEDPAACSAREVLEETGIDALAPQQHLRNWHISNVYPIYPDWLHRYAPGVAHNTEHVFGLTLPARCPVVLNPREHTASLWLPWREAADRCFSASNAEACLMLPKFIA